ncbi:MAG: cell division topological specificity factor MinE [Gammaproteobacteria bacterium]
MKRLLNYFRSSPKPNSAALAKERLQIIIAHERGQNKRDDFLSTLQSEIVSVIARYLNLDTEKVKEQVRFDLAHRGEQSVLELNITIPEQEITNNI